MNTYVCKTCKKPQYSASREKTNEPCIYCGGAVELVEDHAPTRERGENTKGDNTMNDLEGNSRTARRPLEAVVNDLAAEVHKNAVDHGWWDEERDFSEIVALVHSELSEALEEYRNGKPNIYYEIVEEATLYANGEPYERYERKKPEGVVVELADCVIRILDYCGKRKIDIAAALECRRAGNDTYTLPQLVTECHYLISQAYKEIEPRSLYFAECINLIEFWCKENGGNLEEAIRIKHEYNKSRPYRHGGKKC